jgi:hypothetical protein
VEAHKTAGWQWIDDKHQSLLAKVKPKEFSWLDIDSSEAQWATPEATVGVGTQLV